MPAICGVDGKGIGPLRYTNGLAKRWDVIKTVLQVYSPILKGINSNHDRAGTVEATQPQKCVAQITVCSMSGLASKVDHDPWPWLVGRAPRGMEMVEQTLLGSHVPTVGSWKRCVLESLPCWRCVLEMRSSGERSAEGGFH